VTATIPPRARECRLYRFTVWNPHDGYRTKAKGYIGETWRLPLARVVEHVRDQPWADTICGFEVDDRVWPSKDSVLAAEEAAVLAELPIYNYEYNLANPDRVPIPEAVRQRWARDDAAGRPRWVPPQKTDRTPWQRRTPSREQLGIRKPSPPLVSVFHRQVAAAWLLLVILGGGYGNALGADGWWVAASGAVSASALLGWGFWFGPRWKVLRRRR
jgi:hypothetical protein